MATVRALARCYFNHRIYEPGAQFQYEGPQRSCLQLVKGKFTKASRTADSTRLRQENVDLRQRVAELESEKARQEAAAATAVADTGMPDSDDTPGTKGRKGVEPDDPTT